MLENTVPQIKCWHNPTKTKPTCASSNFPLPVTLLCNQRSLIFTQSNHRAAIKRTFCLFRAGRWLQSSENLSSVKRNHIITESPARMLWLRRSGFWTPSWQSKQKHCSRMSFARVPHCPKPDPAPPERNGRGSSTQKSIMEAKILLLEMKF